MVSTQYHKIYIWSKQSQDSKGQSQQGIYPHTAIKTSTHGYLFSSPSQPSLPHSLTTEKYEQQQNKKMFNIIC